MVALPEVKNVADYPEGGSGNVLIPQGQYQALIVGSEFKDTKDKQGKYLALTVVITQGEHANTEFIERLNLVNKNQTAVDIAYKTLASISRALGMEKTPADSVALHNNPIMIEVKNKKSADWTNNDGETVEGKEQSEIKKYLKIPSSGVPDNKPTTSEPTNPPEAKAAEVTAPSANPFAA